MHPFVATAMLAAELAVAPATQAAQLSAPLPASAASPSSNSIPAPSTAQRPVVISDDWTAPIAPPDQAAIRRAVHQTIQEEREAAKAKADAESKKAAIPVRYTMSSRPEDKRDQYEKFGDDFSYAKKPGCLAPNGLKHQKTYIFGGLLAAPFILVAAIRGKCN